MVASDNLVPVFRAELLLRADVSETVALNPKFSATGE